MRLAQASNPTEAMRSASRRNRACKRRTEPPMAAQKLND
jgi:hypothetical protein